MSSDMTYGPTKALSKMTKKELIDLCVARMQDRVTMRQDYERLLSDSNSDLNKLKVETNMKDRAIENQQKDLSIMQSVINDLEEKNRALNVQVLELRKAMKTMSQYL